ncbi:MAG: quinolinate synthase NadA, partial [Pseudomonadales bacterium]|nr:quinolinate synthase NadA [Pseudomonadales bacterium]
MAAVSELTADREVVRKYLDAVDLPAPLDEATAEDYRERIKRLLVEKNATIVAHYYTDGMLQDLADETGGFVGDSLEMARFGSETAADILVVVGVR